MIAYDPKERGRDREKVGGERGMEEEIEVGEREKLRERERKIRREMGTERLGKRDCD